MRPVHALLALVAMGVVTGPPARATAEEPTLLVLRDGRTSEVVRRHVTRGLRGVGELASHHDYMREARARGLHWNRDGTFRALLPAYGVDLVVVLVRVGSRSRRRLRITYRDGVGGDVLAQDEVRYGSRLPWALRRRIVREATLAIAARRSSGPDRADGEAAPPDDPEPAEQDAEMDLPPPVEADIRDAQDAEPGPGPALRVGARLGLGLGQRSLELDGGGAGLSRLSLSAFPAAEIALGASLQPRAGGRVTWMLEAHYLSSLLLRVTDVRSDGSMRDAFARHRRFSAVAGFEVRADDVSRDLSFALHGGWAVVDFDSPVVLAVPDHTVSGPTFRVGVRLRAWDGVVEVGVGPVAHLLLAAGGLSALGNDGRAWSVGLAGELRVRLTRAVWLAATYGEMHTLLDHGRDETRVGTLQVGYEP